MQNIMKEVNILRALKHVCGVLVSEPTADTDDFFSRTLIKCWMLTSMRRTDGCEFLILAHAVRYSLSIIRHIFLELCTGGDLFTYISSRQQLREGEAKYMMYQLLKGIEYLHDRHVSHRGSFLQYYMHTYGHAAEGHPKI